MKKMFYKLMLIMAISTFVGACNDENKSENSDSEVDSNSEADSETAITETDSGTDTETDSGTDSETDSGTDSETNSGTDSETDTATDTGTDTETDTGTDTATDTGTDSETNPLAGIWVARAPGAYFTYDVLDISENSIWESNSNLTAVSHFQGTIESMDTSARQFIYGDTTDGGNTLWYCGYTGTDSPATIYFSETAYPATTGGMEGQDYYTYYKAAPEQCRRYVAAADLVMDGESGTIECGFSADMLALYCTMTTGSGSMVITQGYEDFNSFLNESLLPGKGSIVFELHPGGYENLQYNSEGTLIGTNGANYEITFDTYDTEQRPLTGTMTFSGVDCSPTAIIRSYNDTTRTVTEEQKFADSTGTACPAESRTTVQVYDATGFMVSRKEYDGASMTSETTFNNPRMGIACEFDSCPNPASLPTELNKSYDVDVAGDWEGSATLEFSNGGATLSNVILQMTAGSYQFASSEPWTAFCVKEYGEYTLLAFEKKIPASPPDADIQQVIHLALPTASLGDNTLSGTYNHGSWISGTNIGSVTLTASSNP